MLNPIATKAEIGIKQHKLLLRLSKKPIHIQDQQPIQRMRKSAQQKEDLLWFKQYSIYLQILISCKPTFISKKQEELLKKLAK